MATTTAACRSVSPARVTAPVRSSRRGKPRAARRLATAASAADDEAHAAVDHCSGCPKGETCPCPKAVRRHQRKLRERQQAPVSVSAAANTSRRRVLAAVVAAATGATAVPERASAMSNGLVSDAWSAVSGAPSDLTFPDEFLGTWLCYSTLTQVATPQGEALVQDMAVVRRAQKDVGEQIVYPMRFIRNNQGRVVMDRAWNVARMAEATAKAYNVIESVEWDVDDPNVLTASLGSDGRSVFFRVNQRSEEFPAQDRIETSEVAQIVFDGQNGGYAPASVSESGSGIVDPLTAGVSIADPLASADAGVRVVSSPRQPKIKSSRTYTKWKFRPVEAAGDGPAIVAGQTVYDYLTSFDPGFIDSKGQPVTQYTYKLALFKANKFNLEN